MLSPSLDTAVSPILWTGQLKVCGTRSIYPVEAALSLGGSVADSYTTLQCRQTHLLKLETFISPVPFPVFAKRGRPLLIIGLLVAPRWLPLSWERSEGGGPSRHPG